MTPYDDFKKAVLYRIARNDGSMYLSDLRSACGEGMDDLDYFLHLRELEDEKLVERDRTVDPEAQSDPVAWLTKRTVPYIRLTSGGWNWVRQDRATSTSASTATSPDPDA